MKPVPLPHDPNPSGPGAGWVTLAVALMLLWGVLSSTGPATP